MDEIILWLAVKKLPKIGDITFVKLLKEYKNIEHLFSSLPNKEEKEAALKHAKKELQKAKKLNVKFLCYNNRRYPAILKEIYSPPPLLYYFGNIELLNEDSIAVVGTRNPSDYGKNICKDIVKDLTKYDIVTSSGFARGIDTIVHMETLENKGRTIAVLGCGINIVYPASNKILFRKIVENGLIISEFPLDTKPEPGNFPKRNRIISGISKGIVVIEASKKSGSLITANFALNQGKDVFAVPGNVYNYKSKGTNYLIKTGAYLIENGKEIVEILFPERVEKKPAGAINKIDFPSPVHENVYKIIRENSLNIDELVVKTKLDITSLSSALIELELSGFIKEETGKVYVAIK